VRHVRSIFAGVLIASAVYGPASAAPPTEPAPVPAPDPSTSVVSNALGPLVPTIEQPPPIVDPLPAATPLVVLPAGCTAQPAPVAVFVGMLADADATTARFAVQQIRAGSLDGYAVDTIVDVRYDDDIRFLRTGQQYLVGARPDPITGVLHSKVRSPAPLFGGDAVIGVDDTDVTCPRVEDGVKTLLPDGTEVDTGVLAPLATAKKSLLKAVLKPLGIAVAVLIVLASMKLLIFAMVRAAREREDTEVLPMQLEVQRDRQHADTVADAESGQIPELNSR
jgi:hypothetical protein